MDVFSMNRPSVDKKEEERNCIVRSKPMASHKLAKEIFKTVKKANAVPGHLARGLPKVQTWVRKRVQGIVVIAGDVVSEDIVYHLTSACTACAALQFCFVPTGKTLGKLKGVNLNTNVIMVRPNNAYIEDYTKLFLEIQSLERLWVIPPVA